MLSRGDRIDRYEVVELLGSGGMGEVYRAHDPRLDRPVALKIVRDAGPSATNGHARLLAEARAVAALSHVNVLAVHDAGEVTEPERLRGLAYIAMELVVGSTLRAHVGDRSVSIEQRIGWMRDVASGLAAAHEVGIVHRDVKPENVMIRFDGTVKVLDFGIARRTSMAVDLVSSIDAHSVSTIKSTAPRESPLASTGSGLIGTVAYMAPEQLRGEVADGRADQFAWGVVAYELLTGKSPWVRAPDAIVIVSQILSHAPPAPAEIDPSIPRAVSNAIMRALAKTPSERFSSMKALIAAMGDRDRRSGSSGGASASLRGGSPGRWAVAAGVLGGVVILVGAVATWRLGPRESATTTNTLATSQPPVEAGPPVAGDGDTAASTSAEAQGLYAEALASYHDGTGRTQSLLRRAVDIDPQFAGAFLRLAILGEDTDHADYRHAVALDARLRPRERDLLSAHEAFVAGGDQARDAAITLDRYLAAHPHDEVGWTLRWKLAGQEDEASEIAALDRAITANPSFLHALALRAGLFPSEVDGLHMMDRCMRANSRAVDCIARSIELDSRRGACDEEGSDARRLLVFQPENIAGRDALANALAASKAPVQSIAEALGPGDGAAGAPTQLPRATLLPMFQGNFTEVERVAHDLVREVSSSRATGDHLRPVLALIAAYTEAGDFTQAALAAEDFQARISAWDTPEKWRFLDGFLVSTMARGGRLSSAEANARKAALFQGLEAQGEAAFDSWRSAYGWGVVTEKEAATAVAALDEAHLPVDSTKWPFETLQALVLAGQGERASRRLADRLARDCFALTETEMATKAELYAGRLAQERGEASVACEEYAKVIARWSAARPRSRTATEASARSRALHCPR
jgi:hypothetical protein